MSDQTILIVDDDEEYQMLYGLFLQWESYQILKALNGKEALKVLESEKPDLMVLDMIMPEMDGEGFLTEIHSKGIAQDIPIIVASVNDKIPQNFLDMSNVKQVMKKPFSTETLILKIKEVLGS